ncbi:chemotaxis protein CheB [Luteimonas sp. RIT-PG2_3]
MNNAISEMGPRVALLAREGDARDRIGEALREAGAEVVIMADPRHSSPDEVRDATPQAILVALDASIEDALERYEGLLAEPAYMVIFEEAELAMQRVGWDAARWLRHLSAKLHRHDDVLPPGADLEQDLRPSPGPLPPRAEVADLAGAIAAFADEAQQHAGDVPRDSGVAGVQGLLDDGLMLRDEPDPSGDDAAASILPVPAGITFDRSVLEQSAFDAGRPDAIETDAIEADAIEAGTTETGTVEHGLVASDPLEPAALEPDQIVLERGDWIETDTGSAHADADAGDHDAGALAPSRFGEFEWSDWQLADADTDIAGEARDAVVDALQHPVAATSPDDAGARSATGSQVDAIPVSSWDAPAGLAPLELVDDVAPEYDPATSGLDAGLIEAVAGLAFQAREETDGHDVPAIAARDDDDMPTEPTSRSADDRMADDTASDDRAPAQQGQQAHSPEAPGQGASGQARRPAGGLQLADIDGDAPFGGSAIARVVREFDLSGLSLADDAAAPAATTPAAQAAPPPALDGLLSGLSLVDVDSYGHGPQRGGVLVEAGLGGPDAVRQLLAEIPEGFPRPVFVRLRLDGGRYDRLVTQMERAARLPVLLAQQGLAAEPGTIYFLTPEFALQREKSELVFRRVDDGVDTSGLPVALPAQDTAVLFLSGSDVGLVAQATSDDWQAALVAGQSEEGCYDATAAQALAARGGASASPAGLAQLLFDRWPSPNAPGRSAPEELTW